jgi:ABC-type transport system involved in multi-copper enzyme maturation permease subunit
MKQLSGSNRTKALFWLYLAVGAIGMALVIAMVVSLGGFFVFGWTPPVAEIAPLLIFAAVTLVAIRVTLAWSIRADVSEKA